MKLLVSIATYGNKNFKFLNKVVDEYKSYTKYDITINIHGTENPNIEGVNFINHDNPKNTVFFHREEFLAERDNYDLFLFTEDDILIKEHSIDTYLKYDSVLPIDTCLGFIRFENVQFNSYCLLDLWDNVKDYHYIKNKKVNVNNFDYFEITNAHQSCWILTREKLKNVIDNTDFFKLNTDNLGLESGGSGIFSSWYIGTGVVRKLHTLNIEDLKLCLIEHMPANITLKYEDQNIITLDKLIKDISLQS